MSIKVNLDIENLTAEITGVVKDKIDEIENSIEDLARMTVTKAEELATENLGSLSGYYIDNLDIENPEKGLWTITLKEEALWLEDGRSSGFMKELLEGSSAKISKSGQKYAVIPFKHNKKPSEMSAKAKELSNQIKEEFKKRNIEWNKIELNKNGSPRIGRLQQFSFNENARMKPNHKYSPTHKIAVYQTKNSGGGISRNVVSFRVITEKHENEGLWRHPGRTGEKILENALKWAVDTWENTILPEILK